MVTSVIQSSLCNALLRTQKRKATTNSMIMVKTRVVAMIARHWDAASISGVAPSTQAILFAEVKHRT
jgi:hypothetical protein